MDIPPSAAQLGHELKGKIGYSWAKKGGVCNQETLIFPFFIAENRYWENA